MLVRNYGSYLAVYFGFAIFTNMWFVEIDHKQPNKVKTATKRSIQESKNKKSQSEPNIVLAQPRKMVKSRSISLTVINLNFEINPSENHQNFSLYHSNILFCLYFFGSTLILMADLAMQRVRPSSYHHDSWWDVSPTMKTVIGIYLVNLFLWLDFNYNVKAQRSQATGNTR